MRSSAPAYFRRLCTILESGECSPAASSQCTTPPLAPCSPSSSLASPKASWTHSPYGCRVMRESTADDEVNSIAPPPYVAPRGPTRNSAHQSLSGKCTFVGIPDGLDALIIEETAAIAALSVDGLALPQPLFIGQVRFETSAGELQWLLQHICGVVALRIEPRGPGCFVVQLSSERDVLVVKGLHKKLLFDHNGVWYGANTVELDQLGQYTIRYASVCSRRAHLPRDCVVVEEQKVRPVHNSALPSSAMMGRVMPPPLLEIPHGNSPFQCAVLASPPPPSYAEFHHTSDKKSVMSSSNTSHVSSSAGASLEASPAFSPCKQEVVNMSPVSRGDAMSF